MKSFTFMSLIFINFQYLSVVAASISIFPVIFNKPKINNIFVLTKIFTPSGARSPYKLAEPNDASMKRPKLQLYHI